MGVPVGEIPEGRAVFPEFDHLAVVVVSGVDMNLRLHRGCGEGGDKKECGGFKHGGFFVDGGSVVEKVVAW
jgi:hypothetical protein